MRDVSPEYIDRIKKDSNAYMDKIKSIMPETLASAIDQLDSGYLDQSETTLRTLLMPKPQQEAIRSRLWTLINERQRMADPPRIQLSELASGVGSINFVLSCFDTPLMVAWCAVPTMDYDTRIEAMLDTAYGKMKEILDMPLKDEYGKVDKSVAALILQVAKMVDLRSKGNYVERVEQKTLQVNASAKEAQQLLGLPVDATVEQIEERIKLLEGKGPTDATGFEP